MAAWEQFVDCKDYVYVRHPELGTPYCLPCLDRGARVPLSLQQRRDERGRKVYRCDRPEKHRIVVRQLWTNRSMWTHPGSRAVHRV